MQDISDFDPIHISPNPCKENVEISWEPASFKPQLIHIFTLNGVLLKTQKIGFPVTGSISFSVIDLSEGAYVLKAEAKSKAESEMLFVLK